MISVVNGTVQAFRLICILECVTALAGMAWGGFSLYRHRPDMRKTVYAASAAAIAGFSVLLISALFTEIGRYTASAQLTWRLPVNMVGAGLVILTSGLFSRTGFSAPPPAIPGTTRGAPLVAVSTVLFLMVATSSFVVAWTESNSVKQLDRTARITSDTNSKVTNFDTKTSEVEANNSKTQRIICDFEVKAKLPPSTECPTP